MNENEINLKTTVTRSNDQVSTKVDEETVLMSIEQGCYYSMDGVMTRIWELIENPTSVSEICDDLIEVYEINRKVLEKDVISILKELSEENLIQMNY